MKLKRLMALGMAAVMTMSLTACGGSGDKPTGGSTETDNKTASNDSAPADSTAAGSDAADGSADAAAGGLTYAGIKLGEDYTDITTTIKWMHHKTDRVEDGTLQGYIDEFNKVYPNITVEQEGITDYAETALLRLPTGDWGDIMFIPSIDMVDLETYFIPYGSVAEMSELINFADNWKYQDQCYGVGYMANAQGVLYNKKVFADAGITELPKTPDEFIADLQLIKDNTDAIPLYTNYAAGWTMGGAWDGYLGAITTGDTAWLNQKFTHGGAFQGQRGRNRRLRTVQDPL
jgi:ABC-type glycerol-3-phosphate transport system substrate-binding protein